ncbi:MAG TPA: DUF4397 domain-containing protein, partial [Gemmatimonadales bacterium]|nr:DUF4397 domain-containing protein [Gemmatimonadales bacterium]
CAVTLVMLSGLGACNNDNNGTNPPAQANVRVINASSNTTALNATAGSQSLSSGLNFQNTNAVASCAKVNAGSQTINFTSGSSSTNIGSVTYNFQAGQNYTVVFYGSNNAVVYPETFTAPGTGNMALRFINATATAGDIFLTTPTGTISGSPTISNLAAGQVSGFNSSTAPGGTFVNTYPVANTRVRLFNVGVTTGTPRADFTIGTMGTNRVGTVVLTTSSGTGGATGFLVNSC